MHIEKRYRKAPNTITVVWRNPNIDWLKFNTYSLVRGNLEAREGITRDNNGEFQGAFVINLGVQNVLKTELILIMIALEEADIRG